MGLFVAAFLLTCICVFLSYYAICNNNYISDHVLCVNAVRKREIRRSNNHRWL